MVEETCGISQEDFFYLANSTSVGGTLLDGVPTLGGGFSQQLRNLLDAGLFLVLHLAGGIVAGVFFQVALFAALIDFRRNLRAVIDKLLQLGLELCLGFWGDVLLLLLSHSKTFRAVE